jgi:hypothetical protein
LAIRVILYLWKKIKSLLLLCVYCRRPQFQVAHGSAVALRACISLRAPSTLPRPHPAPHRARIPPAVAPRPASQPHPAGGRTPPRIPRPSINGASTPARDPLPPPFCVAGRGDIDPRRRHTVVPSALLAEAGESSIRGEGARPWLLRWWPGLVEARSTMGSPIRDLPQSPTTPAAPPRFSPVHPAPARDPLPALPSATPSISPPSTTIFCALPSDSLRWRGPSIDADPYCYLKNPKRGCHPTPNLLGCAEISKVRQLTWIQ